MVDGATERPAAAAAFEIRLSMRLASRLSTELLVKPGDGAAFLSAHSILPGPGLAIQELELAPLGSRSSKRHVVDEPLLRDLAADFARRTQSSTVIAHSHPFEVGKPRWTRVDLAAELPLVTSLQRALPRSVHGVLLMTRGGMAARYFEPFSSEGREAKIVVMADTPDERGRA